MVINCYFVKMVYFIQINLLKTVDEYLFDLMKNSFPKIISKKLLNNHF